MQFPVTSSHRTTGYAHHDTHSHPPGPRHAGRRLPRRHPAHAQFLNGFQAGDNVTVSGAGTHGTYQASPIDNTTTSYVGPSTLSRAVGMDQGTFTLAAGGSLSGGPTSEADGLDLGSNLPGQVGGGTAYVTGGTIDGFDGINVAGGVVTITGGTGAGTGLGAGLVVTFSSAMPGTGGTINIIGTNFLVNGLAAPNQITGLGTLTNPLTLTGTVTGTLAVRRPGHRLAGSWRTRPQSQTAHRIASPTPRTPQRPPPLPPSESGCFIACRRRRRGTSSYPA